MYLVKYNVPLRDVNDLKSGEFRVLKGGNIISCRRWHVYKWQGKI